MSRWGVLVWNADGDMGDAIVLGPYRDAATADKKADAVRREVKRKVVNDDDADRDGRRVETLVLPIRPGGSSIRAAVADV